MNIVIRSIRILTCFAKSLYVNGQCSTSKIEASPFFVWSSTEINIIIGSYSFSDRMCIVKLRGLES